MSRTLAQAADLKQDGKTVRDEERIAKALDMPGCAASLFEQQNANTIRGTTGTGENERFTPAEYIEAVQTVLGQIDLDPATTERRRKRWAEQFFTKTDDGLAQQWHGRVLINPPYHR